MAELVGEVAVMESENTRLRDERMREEGRQERVAALEAENARMLGVCQEICRLLTDSEEHSYGEIYTSAVDGLKGDDSALKVALEKARDEGRRTAEANIYSEPNLELCRERDSLRAQLADDSPGTPLGIIKALFEFAEAECGHNPASARHALTTVMETIATLRAQLAERDDLFKEAEKSWAALARKFRDERDEAERKRDENLVQREDMQTKQKCDQLAAQVERLRDTVGDAGNMLRGGKISPQILLADCDERLAETPEQSLAAVREQARREALEESIAKVRHVFECHTQTRARVLPIEIVEALRELAAQPAKEPQS